MNRPSPVTEDILPARFRDWFAARGWQPHGHQLELLEAAAAGKSSLLIAPTGGGKTLAGFLPSLVALAEPRGPRAGKGIHCLYVSPLKALAVDVHRNLLQPIEELGLEIACETRSGDTPEGKRKRQRVRPPQILMTTPESLALLLSYPDAPAVFAGLEAVVVDELHALAFGKRGDLLALGLTRLEALAPGHRRVGLSASVKDPLALREWLSRDGRQGESVALIEGGRAAKAKLEILETKSYLPWSGHMALHAVREVYDRLAAGRTAIVFVNTRAQAELVFQELWHLNEAGLRIALHHGSLAAAQRRKVEAAMAAGSLEAVVATASLDLGIDWAAVDLVVQIGAPKGASRLLQRIGRANHRLDQPSEALLVPGNRFEVLECQAAVAAIRAGTLDGDDPRPGGLDVLAQHIMGMACTAPFEAGALYRQVVRAAPYRELTRARFDRVLAFVATGGYALSSYREYRRLRQDKSGRWRAATLAQVRRYRANVGTIVEAPRLKVRLKGGRTLGEVEEYFAGGLVPGDTFVFAGRLLTFVALREDSILAATGAKGAPKVPAYAGGRLPLSTHLAARVRHILAGGAAPLALPGTVTEWMRIQQKVSQLPPPEGLLIESFPRGEREYMVAYSFEGRNAHQTLGMLLTRRMERAGLFPLGFVATDYVIAAWSLRPVESIAMAEQLLDEDMLGDDLEAWMAESSMLRRIFRQVSVVSGLVEQRRSGKDRPGRAMTISANLIYDVLRRHEPEHLLLEAARQEAAGGMADVGRLAAFLARVRGKMTFRRLKRVSPLAVPILLEIGREQVAGGAIDELLDQGARRLLAEALEVPAKKGSSQAELPL